MGFREREDAAAGELETKRSYLAEGFHLQSTDGTQYFRHIEVCFDSKVPPLEEDIEVP